MEEEDQSKTITFLDRKPHHSGRYLHFDSYTPFKYKINLVKILTFRIRTITNLDMIAEKLKEIQLTSKEWLP